MIDQVWPDSGPFGANSESTQKFLNFCGQVFPAIPGHLLAERPSACRIIGQTRAHSRANRKSRPSRFLGRTAQQKRFLTDPGKIPGHLLTEFPDPDSRQSASRQCFRQNPGPGLARLGPCASESRDCGKIVRSSKDPGEGPKV